jgi:thiol-disulfide isomerase/thioredoxin
MDFSRRCQPIEPPIPLPGLPWVPHFAWINSAPINLTAWRGSPVLIHMWSLSCHNCLGSMPWLADVESRFAPRGVHCLGIHTPEHRDDQDPERVREAMIRHGIAWPIVMDNLRDYWNALGNRYWPTFYFIDRLGQIRFRIVGQIHAGYAEAELAEEWLEALLAE